MARSDTWKLKDQFKKHDPSKQSLMQKGKLATNHFGRPEGIVLYGSDQTSQLEFAVDLDFQQVNVGTIEKPNVIITVAGMQMLCPRCGSPLYIKGLMLGGREIVVHWDKIVQSETDGLFRPTVSIDGAVGCDYYDSEMDEIGKASASNVIMRCGWRGGIINGHCYDHVITNLSKATSDSPNEPAPNIDHLLKEAGIDPDNFDWNKLDEQKNTTQTPQPDSVTEPQVTDVPQATEATNTSDTNKTTPTE
jgi:hypothetical protein